MSLALVLTLAQFSIGMSFASALPPNWEVLPGGGVRYINCRGIVENNPARRRFIQEIISYDEELNVKRQQTLAQILGQETNYLKRRNSAQAKKARSLLVEVGLAQEIKNSDGITIDADLLLLQLGELVPPKEVSPSLEMLQSIVELDEKSKINSWFPENSKFLRSNAGAALPLTPEQFEEFKYELNISSKRYLLLLDSLKTAAIIIDIFRNSTSADSEMRSIGAEMIDKLWLATTYVRTSFAALLAKYTIGTYFSDEVKDLTEDNFREMLQSFQYENFPNQTFHDLQQDLVENIKQLTDVNY